MDTELSTCDGPTKHRVLRVHADAGMHATSDPIRMAHPFTVLVHAADDVEVTRACALMRADDPTAQVVPDRSRATDLGAAMQREQTRPRP